MTNKIIYVENVHKVPAKQWGKWCSVAHAVFNEVYVTMKQNKELYLHPKQDAPRDEYWQTTAWNAAWSAADAVNRLA